MWPLSSRGGGVRPEKPGHLPFLRLLLPIYMKLNHAVSRYLRFHRIYSYITERASIIPGKGCWKALQSKIIKSKKQKKKDILLKNKSKRFWYTTEIGTTTKIHTNITALDPFAADPIKKIGSESNYWINRMHIPGSFGKKNREKKENSFFHFHYHFYYREIYENLNYIVSVFFDEFFMSIYICQTT